MSESRDVNIPISSSFRMVDDLVCSQSCSILAAICLYMSSASPASRRLAAGESISTPSTTDVNFESPAIDVMTGVDAMSWIECECPCCRRYVVSGGMEKERTYGGR
jgi:hypothetical protein